MTVTSHPIGSGREQFVLPGNRFINATAPLKPVATPTPSEAHPAPIPSVRRKA